MSDKLTPIPLSTAAEHIQNQIKEMISETDMDDSDEQKSEKAESLPTEIKDDMMYGESLLAKRISDLISEMSPTDIGKIDKLSSVTLLLSSSEEQK